MAWIAFLFAVVAGVANPFQGATNAEVNKQLGEPLWAGLAVYAIGLCGVSLVLAVVRHPLPAGRVGAVPWWAWTGGLISIVATLTALMLTQKMGSGTFTGVSITASVITSVVLDNFGLVGLKQHTASPGRLIGCALLVAGVWLVAKF